MMKRPKKVMILGLDAPIVPRLYKYAMEGKLPTIARLIRNGVWAKNCLVPLPTITPPNWTAIATGAWPSTAGITDFNVHYSGDPLNVTHGGFYSGDVRAEFVWNAIERIGKRAVVFNYPVSWPPTMKRGYQIGGAGVETNMWFWPASTYAGKAGEPPADGEDFKFGFAQHGVEAMTDDQPRGPRATLSYERLFSTQTFEPGEAHAAIGAAPGSGKPDVIKFEEATGWKNMPKAKKAMHATLVFRPAAGLYQMSRPVWQALALDTTGKGFTKVLICEGRDASRPMAVLKGGQWSPFIVRNFSTELGPRKAGFRMKLLRLTPDLVDFRLYVTSLAALDGWSYPKTLAKEIKSEKGLPLAQPAFFGFDRGWFGMDTLLEIQEMERQFWSDAAAHVLKNKPWDMFIMHYHVPDHAWHSMSTLMDPLTARSEAEAAEYQKLELDVYKMCDRLAKDLLSFADEEETVFAMVSDHGAKATNRAFPNIQKIIRDAGLLALTPEFKVDWSKTKAIGQRSVYVYINVKGRDPQGIVEPGKEYREVQDKVIRVLTDYVDPESGLKPIILALRKEDARFINIYGDRAGDVVFAVSEEFGGQHGPYLPTAEWGLGSLKGLWLMKGPGIKKGVELDRNIWILDMVPTLCYLAGWPIPRDSDGAVIWQALEDPDPRWG